MRFLLVADGAALTNADLHDTAARDTAPSASQIRFFFFLHPQRIDDQRWDSSILQVGLVFALRFQTRVYNPSTLHMHRMKYLLTRVILKSHELKLVVEYTLNLILTVNLI